MSGSNPSTPGGNSSNAFSNIPSSPLQPGMNAGSDGGSGKMMSSEPNLMPVPSPQQIQYLNTFEGQELTIHKQPNTSLRDPSGDMLGILSPT
jgi:hypothetical protein